MTSHEFDDRSSADRANGGGTPFPEAGLPIRPGFGAPRAHLVLMHHSRDMMAAIGRSIEGHLDAYPPEGAVILLHELVGATKKRRAEQAATLTGLLNEPRPADQFEAYSRFLEREEGYPAALIELIRELRPLAETRRLRFEFRFIDMASDDPPNPMAIREQSASDLFRHLLESRGSGRSHNAFEFKAQIVGALREKLENAGESYRYRERLVRGQIRDVHHSAPAGDRLVILVGAAHTAVLPDELKGSCTTHAVTRPPEAADTLGSAPFRNPFSRCIDRVATGATLTDNEIVDGIIAYSYRQVLEDFKLAAGEISPGALHLFSSPALEQLATGLTYLTASASVRAQLFDDLCALVCQPSNIDKPALSLFAQRLKFGIGSEFFAMTSNQEIPGLLEAIAKRIRERGSGAYEA